MVNEIPSTAAGRPRRYRTTRSWASTTGRSIGGPGGTLPVAVSVTVPGMLASRRGRSAPPVRRCSGRRCSGRRPSGTAASNARVYSCCGAAKSAAVAACSTTSPARMTAISSAIADTTPRSWLTSSTAMPSSRPRSATRSRTAACVTTSSAVVGSSSTRTRGRAATAMAMATRCCCPPESWCGKRRTMVSGSGSRTSRTSSATRSGPSGSPCARRASRTCSPTRIDGVSACPAFCATTEAVPPRSARRPATERAKTS